VKPPGEVILIWLEVSAPVKSQCVIGNHHPSSITKHLIPPANEITNHNWLVVLTILKNMKVNGKDYPTYYGK
jgi:hypothetical protein